MEPKDITLQEDASSPLSITKQASPTAKDKVYNFDLFQVNTFNLQNIS